MKDFFRIMGLGSIFELASHFTSSGRRNIEYCTRCLSYLESIHAALHELAARPRRRTRAQLGQRYPEDQEDEEPLRLKRHKPLPLMDDDDWVIIEEDHNAEGKRPLNWDGGIAGRKKHK